MAGLGEGFRSHSPRVLMARDLSAADAGLPGLMTAGRWDSPTMPARYTEAQTTGRSAVARLYRATCGSAPGTSRLASVRPGRGSQISI